VQFQDRVTRLVGVNGSGKTTVGLTAIWAGLKGIAERTKEGVIGERFRFIGNKKASSDIIIHIVDEKQGEEPIIVKNHITKQGNQISFEAPDGYHVDEGWLNNLLNVSFMSASNFCKMSGKEQAIALGIDTSEHDQKLAEKKQEYTLLNRELKSLGTPEEVEKVEPVVLNDLYKKKKEVEDHNRIQENIKQKRVNLEEESSRLAERIAEKQKQIERLKEEIKADSEEIENNRKWIKENKAEEWKDASEIDREIENAEETNQKAQAYREYLNHKERIDVKKSELDKNKEEQKEIEAERLEFIKNHNLGFSQLSIDDNGGLLLNGRPIREPYFSQGERELVVAKLAASQNPELKVRFVDDFDLLDEDNQQKILNTLLEEGFQVITGEVGKTSKDDNTILLKECKVVKDYKETEEELL